MIHNTVIIPFSSTYPYLFAQFTKVYYVSLPAKGCLKEIASSDKTAICTLWVKYIIFFWDFVHSFL